MEAIVPEIDVGLYQDVGALKAMSEERGKQIEALFALTREISSKMLTKDDLSKYSADCATTCADNDALVERVLSLETDRKMVKRAFAASVGVPAFLASVIETARYIVGK